MSEVISMTFTKPRYQQIELAEGFDLKAFKELHQDNKLVLNYHQDTGLLTYHLTDDTLVGTVKVDLVAGIMNPMFYPTTIDVPQPGDVESFKNFMSSVNAD